MKYKIGIDVGGTFTDFFLVADNGDSIMHKTLSTPEDSSEGFITGLKEIAEFSIGHSIISRAAFVGLDRAVKDMVQLIKEL